MPLLSVPQFLGIQAIPQMIHKPHHEALTGSVESLQVIRETSGSETCYSLGGDGTPAKTRLHLSGPQADHRFGAGRVGRIEKDIRYLSVLSSLAVAYLKKILSSASATRARIKEFELHHKTTWHVGDDECKIDDLATTFMGSKFLRPLTQSQAEQIAKRVFDHARSETPFNEALEDLVRLIEEISPRIITDEALQEFVEAHGLPVRLELGEVKVYTNTDPGIYIYDQEKGGSSTQLGLLIFTSPMKDLEMGDLKRLIEIVIAANTLGLNLKSTIGSHIEIHRLYVGDKSLSLGLQGEVKKDKAGKPYNQKYKTGEEFISAVNRIWPGYIKRMLADEPKFIQDHFRELLQELPEWAQPKE